jgi:hypothetical protein
MSTAQALKIVEIKTSSQNQVLRGEGGFWGRLSLSLGSILLEEGDGDKHT